MTWPTRGTTESLGQPQSCEDAVRVTRPRATMHENQQGAVYAEALPTSKTTPAISLAIPSLLVFLDFHESINTAGLTVARCHGCAV